MYVSDPTLTTELQAFFMSMLHAAVCERHNHVEITFGPDVDPVAELPRVERLAWAWKAAGHTNVRTQVEVRSDDEPVASRPHERQPVGRSRLGSVSWGAP